MNFLQIMFYKKIIKPTPEMKKTVKYLQARIKKVANIHKLFVEINVTYKIVKFKNKGLTFLYDDPIDCNVAYLMLNSN